MAQYLPHPSPPHSRRSVRTGPLPELKLAESPAGFEAGFLSRCSEFRLTEASSGGKEGGWCEMVPEFDTSWLCACRLYRK